MKLILIIFIILTCSCNSKVDNVKNDAFIKDIPETIQHPSFQKSIADLEKHLGLPSIENGFNEFQMRIWIGNNQQDTLKTIVLKKFQTIWTAEIYNYVQYLDENGNILNLNKRVELKDPKSGWPLFIDSLFATGISELKRAEDIEGYTSAMHADAVTLEIATTKKYRISQYGDLFSNLHRAEPAKFGKALKLIEIEFGLSIRGLE